MITITHRNNIMLNNRVVNKHKNMLILAPGQTDYRVNEIMYYDSPTTVKSMYGESELYDAFSKAKEVGVPHVFIANVKSKEDYIEMIDVIKQYDFTYIVPLGITFSDAFYNPLMERSMTYSELYAEHVGQNSSSVVLMTDQHADLYEDLDHFLGDMSVKIDRFKTVARKALQEGRCLGLVANHLVNHRYANLILASVLCVAPLSDYPTYDFGPALFDIDDFDIGTRELIFFKNNLLVPTSVENLKNFRIEMDAAKIINIDRVIRFIERELDFSNFKGKFFTDYVKLKIYNLLKEFFEQTLNVSLRSYSIKSIDFVRSSPSAGTIVNTFSIGPINSLEEFDIAMEV